MSSPEAPSEHSDALHSDALHSDTLHSDTPHSDADSPTVSNEYDGTLVSGRSDLLARALQQLDERTADDLRSVDALDILEDFDILEDLESTDSRGRFPDLGDDDDDGSTRDLSPPPAPADDAWVVGAHIGGRYQLVEEVAAGAWGRVWKATQAGVRRPVAVKVLKNREAQSLVNARSRFVREARLASRVRHPSAVRVVDFGYEGEDPYLVMEWLEGVTLAEVLRDAGPAPIELVLGLGRDICAALHCAHEEGVIHRDLKPSNVMLVETSTGVTPVLVDFGLARTFAEDEPTVTRADAVIGTPAYMSPETIQGHALDHTSDIYSLGITLIEALMGINPFRGGSSAETMVKHLLPRPVDEETLVASGCPPMVAALLLSMVAIEPENRPPCAWALSQQFDAELRRATAPARREPEPPALDALQLVTLPPPETVAARPRRGSTRWLRFTAVPAIALIAMAMVAMATQRTQAESHADRRLADATHVATHEPLNPATSAWIPAAVVMASDSTFARPTLAAFTPTPVHPATAQPGGTDEPRVPDAARVAAPSQARADAPSEPPAVAVDEATPPAARPAARGQVASVGSSEAAEATAVRSPTRSSRGETPRAERRASDGQLVLALSPPAHVRINGEDHGERSSLVLRGLPHGRYEIELTRDGTRSRHHIAIRDSTRHVLRL